MSGQPHHHGPASGEPEDQLGLVFGALSDATRRHILDTLLEQGLISVPRLSATLPITRQAVAKHLASLQAAGLVEREPVAHGREVRYHLAAGGLAPAASWIAAADAAWAARLGRLKQSLEAPSGETWPG
ncbi:MAG: metalloregulator ArsR/SmtB family transcription factor [Actinomycetota bacterium]|nr:metalloregulator ArsR/SmtB family transcription factor [Actinomycetota bacterium]